MELFANYDTVNEVLKDCQLIEVNERRRRDLDPLNDEIIQ